MPFSAYITDDEIQRILRPFSMDTTSVGNALTNDEITEIVNEAEGELESSLSTRFTVPLCDPSGNYNALPKHTKNKIKSALKSQIRLVLNRDYNTNNDYSDNDHFQKLYQSNFTRHVSDFLDNKRIWGLKQHSYTEDAAAPVQVMGIARQNNALDYD